MAVLRIVSKAPEGEASRGQDVQVFLVRADGTEINLTAELRIVSAKWSVDSRGSHASIEVEGAEIDATGNAPRCEDCGSTERDDSVVSDQVYLVHRAGCVQLEAANAPVSAKAAERRVRMTVKEFHEAADRGDDWEQLEPAAT